MTKSHNQVLRANFNTTVRSTVARLLKHYDECKWPLNYDGLDWYGDAQKRVSELAEKASVSTEVAAAVVAHLSPKNHWRKNMNYAEILLLQGENPPYLGRQVRSARAAMASTEPLLTLRGPKVTNFALNLLGVKDVVTVDGWAVLAAVGTDTGLNLENMLKRVGSYAALEHCYKVAAAKRNCHPCDFQAVVWCKVRGKAD